LTEPDCDVTGKFCRNDNNDELWDEFHNFPPKKDKRSPLLTGSSEVLSLFD
jgi:hypothetical protein